MPWRQETRPTCKVCQKPRSPEERFSARGLCAACSEGRNRANMIQQRLKAGPYYEAYRRGRAAEIGAVFPDQTTGGQA